MFVPLETVQAKTSAVLTDAFSERLESLLGGLLFFATCDVLKFVRPVESPTHGGSGVSEGCRVHLFAPVIVSRSLTIER